MAAVNEARSAGTEIPIFSVRRGGIKYSLVKPATTAGDDVGSGKSLTIPQQNKIRFDDTKNRVILAAASSGLEKEDDIIASLGTGGVKGQEGIDIAKMIMTHKSDIVDQYTKLIEGNAIKNRDNPWYWTGRRDLRKEYLKKWGITTPTAKQKLKPAVSKQEDILNLLQR